MKHISESIIGKRGTRPVMKNFRKRDLEYGDIVIARDGRIMVLNSNSQFDHRQGCIGTGFYNDDLSYGHQRSKSHDWDIMEIYRLGAAVPDLDDFDMIEDQIKKESPIWKRN